jgi:hypothetical protein
MARLLDDWHLRRARSYWVRAAAAAPDAPAFALRAQRTEARELRRQIDRLIHAADHQLSGPPLGAALLRMPLGTDWTWRADAFRAALPQPGAVAEAERTQISDDLALYHDCPLAEIALRQVRNRNPDDRAPFGLSVEVFGFEGSFLSLATRLPDDAALGLRARHLIRVDAVIEADRPLRGFARLNVRHGPNLAQLVSDLPAEAGAVLVEFDLAYGGIDDTRIERAWLDLIFNDVAMTGIVLRDLVVSRRPRAEV